MNERPKSNETIEDILRKHDEFNEKRQKNPNIKLAATIITSEKALNAKKSVFAQKRAEVSAANVIASEKKKEMLKNIPTTYVLGDVCERVPGNVTTKTTSTNKKPNPKKSFYVRNLEAEAGSISNVNCKTSVIVQDADAAKEIHNKNVTTLNDMPEDEIIAERDRLMKEMDPAIVNFLIKKRKQQQKNENIRNKSVEFKTVKTNANIEIDDMQLSENNPAWELLKLQAKEKWLNFDVIEPHKLHWLRDLPDKPPVQLKPGEHYEARFDWKGILLPYATDAAEPSTHQGNTELYLHGAEEHRPGYTMQELFRLARSTVLQQRVAAIDSIVGVLSMHQQGYYDGVLELPMSKIFFLLRYAFDENTTIMLRVACRGLAAVFFNEIDELLLDLYYDNPHYHRQPSLAVLKDNDNDDDDMNDSIKALDNLDKQMNVQGKQTTPEAEVTVERNDIKASDFHHAESNLVECLMRTNILQRIWYVLNMPQQDNDVISSCIKLLIRIARTSHEMVLEILHNQQLINILNYYATLEHDASQYNQVLCIKLVRVLFTHDSNISGKLFKLFNLDVILEKYLMTRGMITKLRVQMECLRILRQLIVHRINAAWARKYSYSLYYILEVFLHNTEHDVTSSPLICQHASAVMSALNMYLMVNRPECESRILNLINDCCCKWFHRFTQSHAAKELSQITLLAQCLQSIKLCINLSGTANFQKFIVSYLPKFLHSKGFQEMCKQSVKMSILCNKHADRRQTHKALPNVGSLLQHANGPQLIVGTNYGMHLLNAMWELFFSSATFDYHTTQEFAKIIDILCQYIANLHNICFNQYLATNYFATVELTFIEKLLTTPWIVCKLPQQCTYFVAYRVACSFSQDHAREIVRLWQEIIFNEKYLTDVDSGTLKKWQDSYSALLVHEKQHISGAYCEADFVSAINASLTPLLPIDWPYYHLRVILFNHINNVQIYALQERDAIEMTLKFTKAIKFCDTINATQQLMHLMITFMGVDAAYQSEDIGNLLREHLLDFYNKYEGHTFNFDTKYAGMSHFENLYFLFVDHFQASSYGNELFSSLIMVPLAQKYADKWRKRIWSDFSGALYCIQCGEDMLMGGLAAYLEPAETDESLLLSYYHALAKSPRPSKLLCQIAAYHVRQWQNRLGLRTNNLGQPDGCQNITN